MDELCEPARSPPLAITHALFLTEKLVTAVMILPVSLRLKDDGCICFVDVLWQLVVKHNWAVCVSSKEVCLNFVNSFYSFVEFHDIPFLSFLKEGPGNWRAENEA